MTNVRAACVGLDTKFTPLALLILKDDGLRIAIRPRVRSVTADVPPGRDHDGAANRRNNERADSWTTDAARVVDANRAIHDSVGLGNGERHQQGDDCIFHLPTPSALMPSAASSFLCEAILTARSSSGRISGVILATRPMFVERI